MIPSLPVILDTKSKMCCFRYCVGHGPFSHLFDLQFFKKAKPGETWEVSKSTCVAFIMLNLNEM